MHCGGGVPEYLVPQSSHDDIFVKLQLGSHPLAVVQYTFTHKQYTERHKINNTQNNTKIFGRVRAVPHLCGFYPSICLTTEEKAQKNLSQGSRRVPAEVSSSAPRLLHKGLLVSTIKWRCFLGVLCPVRWPMTTLGYVLFKDRSLVFATGLGPEINSGACLSTAKTSPMRHSLVILPDCLAASSAMTSSSGALAILCPPGFTAPNANAPLYTTAHRNSLFVLEFGESEKETGGGIAFANSSPTAQPWCACRLSPRMCTRRPWLRQSNGCLRSATLYVHHPA